MYNITIRWHYTITWCSTKYLLAPPPPYTLVIILSLSLCRFKFPIWLQVYRSQSLIVSFEVSASRAQCCRGISFLRHIFRDIFCHWACYLGVPCHQIDKLILFIQISEIRAALLHFLKESLSIGVIFVAFQNKVLFIFNWFVGTCGTNSFFLIHMCVKLSSN